MIVCGDSANIIPTLANESVDLIVTDPPYGWKFMGKDWDKAVPSVAIWRECLRVLKPGAFAFVMSGPRMDCLSEMGKRLAEAGFETGFTPIFWAYASGFPKAANMGKLVDKRLGAEREIIGKDKHWGEAGPSIGIGGQEWDITAPATPEAQALDGSYAGFQPKPAVEVVIVAMKPLAHGTYIDQALDNRKGVTWLDECRIPYESDRDKLEGQSSRPSLADKGTNQCAWGAFDRSDRRRLTGRFPANLLVSDDAVDDGRVRTSGGGSNSGSKYWGLPVTDSPFPANSGSFSRYFSLDAWAQANLSELPESVRRTFPFLVVPKAGKKEKEMGLDGIPVKQARISDATSSGKRIDTRPSRKDMEVEPTMRRNTHATVKPLKLMSYLITLGSRPGDFILDPFAGTFTTLMAAKILGRRGLGIEIDEQWCRIGRRRVEAVQERML